MKITAELVLELLQEENALKALSYSGTFIDGDYKYVIVFETQTQILYVELPEN